MKMSHVYQPVMIKVLLESSTPVLVKEIAKHFLQLDISQIEYYESITKIMPGKVLSKNNVVILTSEGYVLNNDIPLTSEQRSELIEICDKKISEYIKKRGKLIWQHRRRDNVVPGSLRYEVLKRASFHCELCGISADERALDVDHIQPRSKGGKSAIDNLQALCWKCNTEKRDTDSTDFRGWKQFYNQREEGCLFCQPDAERIITETELAYAFKDGFPVTYGHTLVITKRHVPSMFDLTGAELNACYRMLKDNMRFLESKDRTIKGFNVGVNIGEVADNRFSTVTGILFHEEMAMWKIHEVG